ncbi:MAG: saccharopine dehydrogenase NADP-binding domain-containing protein, partial [Candidatus Altiarchaeota archaeon]|nr:saccharopine dehydrogenase NADP-binding domain-containing protein [Candidatus Altiarchaeota archaeon]
MDGEKIDFGGRVLFVGYGSVAQCTLPILLKHVDVPYGNITIIDFQDRSAALREWTEKGIKFVRDQITRENLPELLGKYLSAGDVLIDLAWNIDCCELLQWCHDNNVLYVNTSVEVWDPYEGAYTTHPTKRTLYWRHMNIRKLVSQWREKGSTAIIEHGANPGLISYFVKQGL